MRNIPLFLYILAIAVFLMLFFALPYLPRFFDLLIALGSLAIIIAGYFILFDYLYDFFLRIEL